MSDPKPFASLGPRLLARKGGAKPAMRPQLQPLHQFHEATAREFEDDLGWNDMGHDDLDHDDCGDVVPIQPELVHSEPSAKPAVVRQQEDVARRVAAPKPVAVPSTSRPRRSALSDGRRAAFTLRVDAERHLKLRLACTIRNRSAQQLVTEALDRLLTDLPDVAELAAQVAKRRK